MTATITAAEAAAVATVPGANIARIITEAANLRFAELADAADADDWSDRERFDRYVTVLRTGKAWAANARTVTVTVVDDRDGRVWGYQAGDVLDYVSVAANLPVATCEITKVSDRQYTLTW